MDVKYITVPFWRRYLPYDIYHTLSLLNLNHQDFDVIIEHPDPNYWVKWQISNLVPKLKWKNELDDLWKKFNLPDNKVLIGVQAGIETKHSSWRNWPSDSFKDLFERSHPDVRFVLLGVDNNIKYENENIIDLREKTSILEALSILKNKCLYFVALDSGLLSLFYYIDADFPIKLLALWGSRNVGVIKQNVSSPNKKMRYIPFVYKKGLQNLHPDTIKKHIYPNDIKDVLRKNNQKKLADELEKLSFNQKRELIKDIFCLDQIVLKKQKIFFSKKGEAGLNKTSFEKDSIPYEKENRADIKDLKNGKKVLASSEAACIIMAAGQGSRLGFLGPKGLFEINKKSLFEHHFEKIIKKQNELNTKLYVSIMTSHLNHDLIYSFLDEKKYFGLEKDQIDFFIQKKAPFLDEKGNWIIDESGSLLQAPDGNGSIFKSFSEADILKKYLNKKIKYISIIPIDNPLCDPFDEKLIGFHKKTKSDVTIKCIERKDQNEKKGAIVSRSGKIKIIEYIYLDPNLKYKFSNTGIYLLNLSFIDKIKNNNLNYQFVLKRIENDKDIFAYKSESFIFDSFEFSDKINILVDEKQKFYAPLKEKSDISYIENLLNLEKTSVDVIK
ncbi:MAG: UTP--glucose-1-phosphate uridylyltransferase [Parachlamydiales bacterium]